MILARKNRLHFNPIEWTGSLPSENQVSYDMEAQYVPVTSTMKPFNIKKEISVTTIPFGVHSKITTIEQKSHLTHINKQKTTTSQLLDKVAQTYQKILVERQLNGAVIAIQNKDEIMARWEVIKEELSDTYKGNLIEKFIQRYDMKIKNMDSLIRHFQTYTNYGLLLNFNYGNYSSANKTRRLCYVTGSSGIAPITESIILDDPLESQMLSISLSGKSDSKHHDLSYTGNYTVNDVSNSITKSMVTMDENTGGEVYRHLFTMRQKM